MPRSRSRIFDTDRIKLTRALRDKLAERCTPKDGCLIYATENRRHIDVEMYARTAAEPESAVVSVRRVAWALAHPESHVTIEEDVINTCGNCGDGHSGSGTCVAPEHLRKVPRGTNTRGTDPRAPGGRMIARIEITYGSNGREKVQELCKDDAMLARFRQILPDIPEDPERRANLWSWGSWDFLIDLDTDGRFLVQQGISFEVKNFKGTMPLASILPPDMGGATVNVHVQIPHVGLLAVDEVQLEENCCTDRLQACLNDGWRILCVCPPNAARRPDYILGRTRSR